jgi:hypothetical protein
MGEGFMNTSKEMDEVEGPNKSKHKNTNEEKYLFLI